MTDPTPALTLLGGDQEVVVTREDAHQETISRWAPGPDGRPRPVTAELVAVPIGHGPHRGRPGIEVRVDGHRVGELTHLMAQRYLPLVDAHLRAGRRPAVVAVVRRDHRGLQVDLRLPRPGAVVEPGPAPGTRATVRYGAPVPPPGGPAMPWATGRGPAGPPPADPPRRSSGGRRRRTPWLVGAGIVALLVAVGTGVGGKRDTTDTAASPTAAGTTTTIAPTSAPARTSAPATVPRSTAEAPPVVVAASGAAGREVTVPAPANRPAPAPAPARTAPVTPRTVPKTAPPAAVVPVSKCDPNYSGACVPIASDVDCAGGKGNGPAYVQGPVRVIGKDIYGLDADHDGIGCE